CGKEAYGKITGSGLAACKENSLVEIEPNVFTISGFNCVTDIYAEMMLAVCSTEKKTMIQSLEAEKLIQLLLKIYE
ncbi:MAG: hypothetical protein RR263_03660, partial [Oscillospiraceae bacterium]